MHDHVVEHLERREHSRQLKESVPRVEHEAQSVRCRPIRIRWKATPIRSACSSASAVTSSRAATRASDSLTASRSSPSRGSWCRRCPSIHERFSARMRSTSARLVDCGTVSRAGSPQGASSLHRRARGECRTSTASIRTSVASASAEETAWPYPRVHAVVTGSIGRKIYRAGCAFVHRLRKPFASEAPPRASSRCPRLPGGQSASLRQDPRSERQL